MKSYLEPLFKNVGKQGEMKPIRFAIAYGMGVSKLLDHYWDLFLAYDPSIYYCINNSVGFPEGAD